MKPTYYTAPPAAKIAAWMNCDLATAKMARAVMKGEVRTLDNPAFPETSAWVASCYNRPSRRERIMSALNELLGCHGSEPLWGEDPYWPEAEYLNTGDTYNPTILFYDGRFILTTWGDFFERNEKRLALH